MYGGAIMIRHILLWKYTEEVKNTHTQEQALATLKQSVSTLYGISGLIYASIDPNLEENEYDLIFYSEFVDKKSLDAFKKHPLHIAHAKRCMPLVTGRLGADVEG